MAQSRPRGAISDEAHEVQLHDPALGGCDRRLIAPADALGQAAAAAVDDAYDTKVKIGEALEAAARVVGDQPARAGAVDGVAEQAQAAADANANAEEKANVTVTIADVLAWDATEMVSTEKAVTEEDAAAAAEAEAASDPGAATRAYGVSDALAAAARRNREDGERQSKRSTQPPAADECTAITLAKQFDRI
uniref:SMP domain-containing protein n=1 Tax=Leersia perrieri TaxID=77586 RepID=A0A0D9VYY9_9ORYZ